MHLRHAQGLVRRFLSILLLLCFVSTGAGLSADLHRAQHELEHAHAGSHHCHHLDADGEQHDGGPFINVDPDSSHHDGHCQICLDVRVTTWAEYTPATSTVSDVVVARPASVDSQCDRLPFLLQIDTTGPPAR